MAKKLSLQLFEKISAGQLITASDLDNLITEKVCEDNYLEYKRGNLLDNKDAPSVLREYISGFANSMGGLLIIGVNETGSTPTSITGCNQTRGKLDEWAARCLTPIANQFSPLPAFQIISHPNGDVLVCIIQRSMKLIQVFENGSIVYYFRIHDQTVKAPEFLIADIILGRRQQPVLEVIEMNAVNLRGVSPQDNSFLDLFFDLKLRVENAGLVWADDVRWGLIYRELSGNSHGVETSRISQFLMSYIDVKSETLAHPNAQPQPVHSGAPLQISKPFDTCPILFNLSIPLGLGDKWFSYTWNSALFITARNSSPLWYQVSLFISNKTVQLKDNNWSLVSPEKSLSILKLTSERPIVGWIKK